MTRTFYHSKEEKSAPPCITRLHIERSNKTGDWHIVVFSRTRCAGVLVVGDDCGQPLVDLLLPEVARIEGGTRKTD
jgi:hypothetical protein